MHLGHPAKARFCKVAVLGNGTMSTPSPGNEGCDYPGIPERGGIGPANMLGRNPAGTATQEKQCVC